MRADIQRIKRYLKSFRFQEMFIDELGWNYLQEAPHVVTYNQQQYTFVPVAQKEHFHIYQHTFPIRIPDQQTLKQLDRQLDTNAEEHLTIFVDASQQNQAWLWVKKGVNRSGGDARLNRLNKNQSGELLAQKISNLFVSIDDEDSISIIGVVERVILGFDIEKLTNDFYKKFQEKHDYFLGCIKNISDEDDRKWYTSIMLNRLMFTYFLQRKGLLDNTSMVALTGDMDYLQNRFKKVQQEDGSGQFYPFLRRLFHEGFNLHKDERPPAVMQMIKNIPYINGGLFDVHPLESHYADIQISDDAFEKLFELFQGFDWHLDDRPMRSGNEINPDVLGYIFEKYINQKQMGAYYTKEDITEYISKNTIIPFLFEKVGQQYPDAFAADGPIWSILKANPNEYIYEDMAHGYLEPLPPEIAAGIHDVAQRTLWNRPADEQWALATETWREVVERRLRYEEVKDKLAAGEMHTVNDLITYNLDITRFADEVIATCKDPALLRAFYEAIEQVTVLDPTCGSGAFLFAALNILKPLYETCLKRMQELHAAHEQQQAALPRAQRHDSKAIVAFKRVLARAEQHRNRDYYILKSIIINNLYGVDIMEEAIEICKLRLFLKLVAQIKAPHELEPLPDIDFNVLPGNTLIGFTSLDEIRRVTAKLFNVDDTEKTLTRIEQKAQEIERAEHDFRSMQADLGMKSDSAKERIRILLNDLLVELDPFLATEYQITKEKCKDAYESEYLKWHKSHKPFHWWAEFHEIMNNGGFNVIIGNPPYVEYSKVKKAYEVKGYLTVNCGNLFAMSVERMELLSGKQGSVGVIIPVASISTDGYITLQKLLTKGGGNLIISNYDDRPSKLFDGLEHIRLSIILHYGREVEISSIFATKYNKWNKDEREKLFKKLTYAAVKVFVRDGSIPKLQNEKEESILRKVLMQKRNISYYEIKRSSYLIYYSRKLSGFVQVLDHMPLVYDAQEQVREPSELKTIAFETPIIRNVFLSILNSSLFFWYLTVYSDCRHLNKREVYTINFDLEQASQETIQKLSDLSSQLMNDLNNHSKMLEMKYEKQGRLLIQCFYPKHSKPIIDEIDRVLAQHYGFTPEELDYIMNYDIKYRMGRDNGEESEE